MRKNTLKLNFNSNKIENEFNFAMLHIPKEVEVYIVAGSVRNALYRELHGEVITQRDYDQVVTNGTVIYKQYLSSIGFEENPYPSHRDIQTVYRKRLREGELEENYIDWVVFDMHTFDGATIEDNIRHNVSFTINALAIKGNDILSKPWEEAIIEGLPNAIQDIKDKRLRVNKDGYKRMPSNFYAMLRLMSKGYSAPPVNEIQLLLQELPKIEHSKFNWNIKKVWSYVGGEEKARWMVRDLGIDIDVFNEHELKTKIK